MRRKAVAAWILVALALLFGFLGRSVDADPLYFLSGLFFLTAMGIFIGFLPVWAGFRDRVPAMPGLFPRVQAGLWDPVTGQPGVPKKRK